MENNLYQTILDNTKEGNKEQNTEVVIANPVYTDITGSINLWGISQDDTIH